MRRGATTLLAVAASLLLIASPAIAAGGESGVTLNEIETEVMCPVCGTLLQLAEAPQAQRQKAFIERLIEEGRTEEEIKDRLVAEYGEEVLALPQGSGFDLSAYLVPIVAFLAAAVALALGVLRWRRASRPPGGNPPGAAGPSDADAERLEKDLARYDL